MKRKLIYVLSLATLAAGLVYGNFQSHQRGDDPPPGCSPCPIPPPSLPR